MSIQPRRRFSPCKIIFFFIELWSCFSLQKKKKEKKKVVDDNYSEKFSSTKWTQVGTEEEKRRTCSWCDSILPGLRCKNKGDKIKIFSFMRLRLNLISAWKRPPPVTIWWCTWGWAGWRCCRRGRWWSRSCTSVSLGPNDAADTNIGEINKIFFCLFFFNKKSSLSFCF